MKMTYACLVLAFVTVPGFAHAAELLDTFDNARDSHPGYGLNDALGTRQHGTQGGLTYHRLGARPWYAQVNHPSHPNQLS